MHVDSSGYGRGAVRNETTEARGFWYDDGRELHITYKELKAVRYAVLTFLSEMRVMIELRKLWFILDTHGIFIRARYTKTTANIWADRLSREIDYDEWAFNLRYFNHVDIIWGRHIIDISLQWRTRGSRATTPAGATLVVRPQLACPSPTARGVAITASRRGCNPRPWGLIDNHVIQLHTSGMAATVIVPY
eukprot:jgi/Tetstr1/439355/TSEL_027791.t1